MTLGNDRRLRPSAEGIAYDGARWRVIDRHDDGALVPPRSAAQVPSLFPPPYVVERVALAYALTIHNAQRATSGRAVVLVDEQMSAAQLYVAMTRGRSENSARIVTGGEERDHQVRAVCRSGVAAHGHCPVSLLGRPASDRPSASAGEGSPLP